MQNSKHQRAMLFNQELETREIAMRSGSLHQIYFLEQKVNGYQRPVNLFPIETQFNHKDLQYNYLNPYVGSV